MKTIAAISGTSRPDSYTSRALGVTAEKLRSHGAVVEILDARELNLPFPGHDPTPDTLRLREAVRRADGILLATPEYHGSFSAMTKLIIENLGFPSAWEGKPVALLGVASGRLGAVKSLEQLRGVCAHTGAIVLPRAVSIAGVRAMFDEQGRCTDPGTEKLLDSIAGALVRFIDDYVRPKVVLEAIARGDFPPWSTEV